MSNNKLEEIAVEVRELLVKKYLSINEAYSVLRLAKEKIVDHDSKLG